MLGTWLSSFLGLAGILFVLLYKYSTRKYDYWKKRNIQEIKPVPFLGNILPVMTLKKSVGVWLWEYYNKIDADYFGIFAFDQPILVVKSTNLVKAILQRDFDHFQDRTVADNTSDPVMKELIFFMKNPAWKPIRSKLSPIFTSGKLKAMFPLIINESKQMTDYISTLANVPNVDAKEISAKYSTNVVARCAFAVDAGSFKNENAEFRSLTREMFGFSADSAFRQIGSWFFPNFIKTFKIRIFPPNIVDPCKRIFRDILQSKKELGSPKVNDLIDMLLEVNRKKGKTVFTDNAMVGHALQFLAAGFETVSATLSFGIYELAINPEVQERLRAEILEGFEKNNELTYAVVNEMKYLDMVVCETLRKYPGLPFLDRTCKADYKVEGTDLVIEKGMPVFIPMFGLHYDSKYFPEPNKFDPERFADKSWINRDGMFYIPFGEGPRICIGERFGLQSVKLGLASILLKFRAEKSVETPIPLEYEPRNVVLQSKVGIPLTFVPL